MYQDAIRGNAISPMRERQESFKMKGVIVIAIGFVFTTVLFLVGMNVWGGS